MVLRIDLTPVAHNNRGPVYAVWFGGTCLIERARDPFTEGERALAAAGYSGPFALHERGCDVPRMTGVIERAAQLTVTEGAGTIVRFAPYKEYADAED